MKPILTFIVSLGILLVSTTSMYSQTDISAMVKRQAVAWETQNVSSLVADFAPDAVFIAGGFTYEGVDVIQKAAEDYFRQVSNTKVEIKRIIIEDRQGAVEWDWRDRNAKTGKLSAAEDAIIFELNDEGKITYWREYIEKVEVTQ